MYRGRIARLCPDLMPVERQHSVFAYALTMEVRIPEHVLRKKHSHSWQPCCTTLPPSLRVPSLNCSGVCLENSLPLRPRPGHNLCRPPVKNNRTRTLAVLHLKPQLGAASLQYAKAAECTLI